MGAQSLHLEPEGAAWGVPVLVGVGWVGVAWRPIPGEETGGATRKRRAFGVGWDPPDLTLPLVEMAEMDRPVMEVTVTESRMMIQVRTGGRGGWCGGDVITRKLSWGISQVGSHVRNLN